MNKQYEYPCSQNGALVDLHIHTTASDGLDSINKIIIMAKRNGLAAIAITDHNSMSALKELSTGTEILKIEIIPGAEFSIRHVLPIHILGLYLDADYEKLLQNFQKMKEVRTKLVTKSFIILRKYGIKLLPNQIIKEKGYLSISNMIDFLSEKKLLARSDKLYASLLDFQSEWKHCLLSPSECISLIHSSNGLAILAHPQKISNSDVYLKNLIKQLCEYGLDGIEAIHPDHSYEDTKKFILWANELGLLCTGGSDYHGNYKYKSMKSEDDPLESRVPYFYLELLKNRLKGR